jgi:CBS domain-containing protein
MSKPLITVDGEASAKDSIKLMVERDIGALVITEKGKPVGIVTERDVLKKCCIESSWWEFKISEIMSSPLVTVEAEKSILTAEETMDEKTLEDFLLLKEKKS